MREEREDEVSMSADLDAFAARVGRAVRAPAVDEAAFAARVMAAVREDLARQGSPAADESAWRPEGAAESPYVPYPTGLRRLSHPRTVRVSPLLGLAIAAGFAGTIAFGAWTLGARAATDAARGSAMTLPMSPAAVAATTATRTDTVRLVQFVLVAPGASKVTVAGDFNDWNPAATPLQPVRAGGVWMVSVPLAPGRYEYSFIVDGESWVADPSAPTVVESDFGDPSSVVTVGEARS